MIYSVVRVSATSGQGAASEANNILRSVGFVGEKKAEHFLKWGRPNHGERFVLHVEMKLKNAGSFELFRQVEGKWISLYRGRVTSLEANDSTSTKIFVCVCGSFNQISFITPIEPVSEKLADVPPLLFSKGSNGMITVRPDGVEVFEDEQVVQVDPRLIRRFVGQPRVEKIDQKKLHELGQSILSIGQLKAIDLYPIPSNRIMDDGCLYEISFDGERRWLACMEIGSKVKAVIRNTSPGNDVQRFVKSFASNLHSEAHTVYEMVCGVIWLYERVKDVSQVHQSLGLSLPTIYAYLRLRSLNPELLEMMRMSVPEERRLRLEHAKKLSNIIHHDEQKRIYESAYNYAKEGTKAVTRALDTLVDGSSVEKIRTKTKHSHVRAASRSVQTLISAVEDLGKNPEGFQRHLLFIKEDSRQKIETALLKVEEILPKLIETVRALAS